MAANDIAHDFAVARRIELVQVANGQVSDLLRDTLRPADRQIAGTISEAPEPADLADFGALLIGQVSGIQTTQTAELSASMRSYLGEVAASEVEAQVGFLDRLFSPLGLTAAAVGAALVLDRVLRTPAQGRTPRQWMDQLAEGDRQRVAATIRSGVAAGQSNAELRRSVVGAARLGPGDGVRSVTRRGVETMVQSLTVHAAAQASAAVWEANPGMVDKVRWVSTLDGRTSSICQVLDGTIFPVGRGRRPPAHPNCRSVVMPIIPKLSAIPDAPSRTILPANVVDRFDGRPPRVLRYEDWLRGRSARFQDRVLGPSRGKLFRQGNVSLERFVNDRGQRLSLDELRRRLPDAFEEVGL